MYRAKGWRACVVLELIFGAVGSGVLWYFIFVAFDSDSKFVFS